MLFCRRLTGNAMGITISRSVQLVRANSQKWIRCVWQLPLYHMQMRIVDDFVKISPSTQEFDWSQDVGGLNIYDILEPCYHGPSTWSIMANNDRLPASFRRLGETERPLPVRKRMFGRAWPLRAPVRDGRVPTWSELLNSNSIPCTVSPTALHLFIVDSFVHLHEL